MIQTLKYKPQRVNYKITPYDDFIRLQNNNSYTLQSHLNGNTIIECDFNWVLKKSELVDFENFYRTKIHSGTSWFYVNTIDMVSPDTIKLVRGRFSDGYKANRHQGDYWIVNAKIEINGLDIVNYNTFKQVVACVNNDSNNIPIFPIDDLPITKQISLSDESNFYRTLMSNNKHRQRRRFTTPIQKLKIKWTLKDKKTFAFLYYYMIYLDMGIKLFKIKLDLPSGDKEYLVRFTRPYRLSALGVDHFNIDGDLQIMTGQPKVLKDIFNLNYFYSQTT